MLSYPPPLTQHVHIQTDGDYTKRVVTPFGTTRLKMNIVLPTGSLQIRHGAQQDSHVSPQI